MRIWVQINPDPTIEKIGSGSGSERKKNPDQDPTLEKQEGLDPNKVRFS